MYTQQHENTMFFRPNLANVYYARRMRTGLEKSNVKTRKKTWLHRASHRWHSEISQTWMVSCIGIVQTSTEDCRRYSAVPCSSPRTWLWRSVHSSRPSERTSCACTQSLRYTPQSINQSVNHKILTCPFLQIKIQNQGHARVPYATFFNVRQCQTDESLAGPWRSRITVCNWLTWWSGPIPSNDESIFTQTKKPSWPNGREWCLRHVSKSNFGVV